MLRKFCLRNTHFRRKWFWIKSAWEKTQQLILPSVVQWIGVLENLKTTSIWIASTSPPWQEPCVCVMNPPLKNMNEQAGIEYQWMSWINFWVIFVKHQLPPTCNISGRPGQAGAERELLGSQIFPVVHQGSLWILGGYWGWRAVEKLKCCFHIWTRVLHLWCVMNTNNVVHPPSPVTNWTGVSPLLLSREVTLVPLVGSCPLFSSDRLYR